MEKRIKVLITAGGTSEKIDDVRVVTNISTGRFGAELADAFSAHGAEVTLLRARGATVPRSSSIAQEVFFSSDELEQSLFRICSGAQFDIVLMAAAVSDFVPVPRLGKISSDDQDLISIEMKRRSKILPNLRKWCGEKSVIVGFKLLSGATAEELRKSALSQLHSCRLDFVVANDLTVITETRHPILLLRRDTSEVLHNGSRVEVAECLVGELIATSSQIRF